MISSDTSRIANLSTKAVLTAETSITSVVNGTSFVNSANRNKNAGHSLCVVNYNKISKPSLTLIEMS